MALNPKQRAFVREYLASANATQAAKNAGYSARTAYSQGQRLLKHVEVRAELEKKERTLDEKCGITPERILRETAALAFADVTRLFDKQGQMLPPGKWDKDTAAAVAGVDYDRKEAATVRVKMRSKEKALELLGTRLNLFRDKVEVSADENLAELLARSYQRKDEPPPEGEE